MITNTITKGAATLSTIFDSKIKRALKSVCNEINKDVDNISPKIPVDTGALRASFSIVDINKNTVECGYGNDKIDYAVKTHEWTDPAVRWTRQGSGPKYFQSKLADPVLQQKYISMLTNGLKIK